MQMICWSYWNLHPRHQVLRCDVHVFDLQLIVRHVCEQLKYLFQMLLSKSKLESIRAVRTEQQDKIRASIEKIFEKKMDNLKSKTVDNLTPLLKVSFHGIRYHSPIDI